MDQKNNQQNDIQEEIIKRMIHDRKFRIALSKKSLYWFCQYYFHRKLKMKMANFHKEIIYFLQEKNEKLVVIAGFRGCGKSTLATRFYPIWSVLGVQEKKFVVVLGQTQRQAEQYLMNIKEEFEKNPQLISDFSPFKENRDQWGRLGIVMSHYESKILAASCEQPIRGMTFLGHRPDLLVLDDVESMESIKTEDGRKKLLEWYRGDIIPAGDPVATKIVIVGGILGHDSFISFFRKKIGEKEIDGKFLFYPVIKNGEIIWKEKYPDLAALEAEKRKGQSKSAFDREFMLEIVPDDEQIIMQEWFEKYKYEVMPDFSSSDYRGTYIAIDPAFSEKDKADKTAMVAGSMFGYGEKAKIYIHPYPINEQLSFKKLKEKVRVIYEIIGPRYKVTVGVENVAGQKWLHEDLKAMGMQTELFDIHGLGKEERLRIAASMIEAERVLFPAVGIDELRKQTVGFGSERYKDLADSFSMVILYFMNQCRKDNSGPRITIFDVGSPRKKRRNDDLFDHSYDDDEDDETW